MKTTILILATACASLANAAQFELISPIDGQEISLLPDEQLKVMSLATRAERKHYAEACGKAPWRHAKPVELVWRSTADKPCIGVWQLELSRQPDLSKARHFFGIAEATNSVIRFAVPYANLELGVDYYWRVKWRGLCKNSYFCDPQHGCQESTWTSVSPTIGHFVTAYRAPRWIALEGRTGNVRDLGGRLVPGGRVRQNLAFRGEGLNDNSEGGYEQGRNRLTIEDRNYLVNTLGIKTDLDLRSRREIADMCESPLGASVRYVWHSSCEYANVYTPEGKRVMAENIRLFCDRANYPIYFHCIAGADRTGAVAYMLNGLLGVSKKELDIDWEMTFYDRGVPDRIDKLTEPLLKYGASDSTWQQRIVLYLKDCGLTDAELSAIREIMIER